jgi:hypothetical protein
MAYFKFLGVFSHFCIKQIDANKSILPARQSLESFCLKGQCHEIFDSGFFHESPSPKPLIITLGSFRIFLKILGDIRNSRCTTGVNDTGGELPPVSTTPAANLPPVSTTPAANLSPVSLTPVANNGNNIRLQKP